MWSKPLLWRFQQSEEIPQTQVSQGFAVFRLAPSRIPPRHSQSKRATNCANPGFLVIEFCTRCGQTCGQAVFLTTSTCGGSACIAGVSRDCGHSVFRLEGGAARSQSKRTINGPTFELPFDTGQASSPHPNGRASLLRSPAIIPPARRGCKNYLRCAERFGASLARVPLMASCSWRISPCSFLTLHEAFSSVTTALSATTARLRRSADKSASS